MEYLRVFEVGVHIIDYDKQRVGKVVNKDGDKHCIRWAGENRPETYTADEMQRFRLLDIFR